MRGNKVDFSKIYSPYKLGMFAKCPKSYHFSYLDPVYSSMKYELKKLPQNIYSFHTLGKAVHNAITLFYHLPVEKRSKETVKDLLVKTWTSEVSPNKKPPLGKWGGFETLEEERQVYRRALLMLANFWKIAEIEPEIEYLPTDKLPCSIDDYLGLITPLSDDFDISGKFDLVVREPDDCLHVVDFKTSKREEENDFQLKFYKILAERKFQKPVNKASFYFLSSGNKKEFDLQEEKSEEITKEILGRIERIKKAKDFPTNPTKLCQFCLYKNFCSEKEKVNQIIKGVEKEDYSDDLPF